MFDHRYLLRCVIGGLTVQLFLDNFQRLMMRQITHIELWIIKVNCGLLLRLLILLNADVFSLFLNNLLQIKECLICQVGLLDGLAIIIGWIQKRFVFHKHFPKISPPRLLTQIIIDWGFNGKRVILVNIHVQNTPWRLLSVRRCCNRREDSIVLIV